jgi:CRP-like cAMP-binding protein
MSLSNNDHQLRRRTKTNTPRSQKVESMPEYRLIGRAAMGSAAVHGNGNGHGHGNGNGHGHGNGNGHGHGNGNGHGHGNGNGHKTTVSQKAALVQHFALFSNISSADRTEIVSAAHEKAFLRRQTIFLQGDPMEQIILLTSGSVKITQVGQNGTEVILRLSGPGDLVGATGLWTRCNHCSMALALRSSTALVWGAAVFEALSERFPILRHNAARILGEHLRELEERFREISTENVAPRLGHAIARLLDRIGERENGAVKLRLSHEELAQMTGTTLFTVCRLLSQWEQQGIVSTGREAVMVHNPHALAELSESE